MHAAPFNAQSLASLSDWLRWAREHEGFIMWPGIISATMFVGSLVVVHLIVTRMGEDYFMPDRPRSFADSHPVVRIIGLIGKNLLGVILLLIGIAMIFMPGQGLLTILMGLALLNFPGKRKAELRLVRYPPVHKSINWIRKKAHKPPLRIPAVGED